MFSFLRRLLDWFNWLCGWLFGYGQSEPENKPTWPMSHTDLIQDIINRHVSQYPPDEAWDAQTGMPGVLTLRIDGGKLYAADPSPLHVLMAIRHPDTPDIVKAALEHDERFTIKVLYVFAYTDAAKVYMCAQRLANDGYWQPIAEMLFWAYDNNLIGRKREWKKRLYAMTYDAAIDEAVYGPTAEPTKTIHSERKRAHGCTGAECPTCDEG